MLHEEDASAMCLPRDQKRRRMCHSGNNAMNTRQGKLSSKTNERRHSSEGISMVYRSGERLATGTAFSLGQYPAEWRNDNCVVCRRPSVKQWMAGLRTLWMRLILGDLAKGCDCCRNGVRLYPIGWQLQFSPEGACQSLRQGRSQDD